MRFASVLAALALCLAAAAQGFHEGLSYGDSDQQKIDLWIAETEPNLPR